MSKIICWPFYLYIALFPYLLVLTIVGLISCDLIILVILLSVIELLLLFISMTGCLLGSLRGKSRSNLFWTLAVKLIHLPVHVLMILLTMGMMNPFLLVIAWLPLLLSFMLMGLSGTLSAGTAVNSFRLKEIGLGFLILFIVLGFLYIVDIIISIIRVVLSK